MPSWPGRLVLGREVRDLHDRARAPRRSRRGSRARTAPRRCSCRAIPGASTIWSAPAIASSASGAARRVGGLEPHVADAVALPRVRDRDLAGDALAADLGGQRHRVERRGQHPADRAEQPAASSSAAVRSPSVSARPTSTRLPSAWPASSPERKRCSNAAGHGPSSLASATETAPQVAGRGHVEVAAQPAGAAAVVGDAHDRGDLARVLAHARAARPTSRALRPVRRRAARTSGVTVDVAVMHDGAVAVRAQHARRVAPRSTTLRCRPPVQPTPIDRYALPFVLEARQRQLEQAVELGEELRRSRPAAIT